MTKRLKENPKIKISSLVEEMLDSILAKDLYNEMELDVIIWLVLLLYSKKMEKKKQKKEEKNENKK